MQSGQTSSGHFDLVTTPEGTFSWKALSASNWAWRIATNQWTELDSSAGSVDTSSCHVVTGKTRLVQQDQGQFFTGLRGRQNYREKTHWCPHTCQHKKPWTIALFTSTICFCNSPFAICDRRVAEKSSEVQCLTPQAFVQKARSVSRTPINTQPPNSQKQ